MVIDQYRDCKLVQHGILHSFNSGQPHTIIEKYIHLCEIASPERCCAETDQTEGVEVDGDRGQTWLLGECPACKAAEEASFQVFTVSYMCDCFSTSC